ncbi:MFS transporter [Oceanidesulfovibrio marinus]|uniref:MFS transporter n=1 Tax=Oceanidesulfovibrio marinus TaxID=370038 RepID=A0ABX6NGB8_9BACT|nr:MFS transporter [Oceanidesulfovibrio marinus]QJT09675.1 MFS transporter [Oceanidesulfovibrio marinus]
MQRVLPLAGLCLAVFLAMIGMGMAGVALPQKYIELSGSMRSAGWLSSFFAISYMACQYPAGRMADTFGYRRVLACGFLLMAAAAWVFSEADTTMALYAGRFLQGAGEAPVWASAPALLGSLYPDNRGRAMGFYNAAFHLGLMLGPIAGALQAAHIAGSPFAAFAWLCLAAVVLVLVTVRTAASPRLESGKTHDTPAAVRSLWPLACCLPLSGAVYGLITSSIPVYLTAARGFSQSRLGVFLFCLFSGIAAAQCLAGRLSDRYGRRPFMVGGLLGIAAGLVGLLSGSQPLLPASTILLGLSMGAFAVSSMALVNETVAEGRQATVSGYYYLVWGSGYFAGPLLANSVGLESGSLVLAAGLLAAAAILFHPSAKPGTVRQRL